MAVEVKLDSFEALRTPSEARVRYKGKAKVRVTQHTGQVSYTIEFDVPFNDQNFDAAMKKVLEDTLRGLDEAKTSINTELQKYR